MQTTYLSTIGWYCFDSPRSTLLLCKQQMSVAIILSHRSSLRSKSTLRKVSMRDCKRFRNWRQIGIKWWTLVVVAALLWRKHRLTVCAMPTRSKWCFHKIAVYDNTEQTVYKAYKEYADRWQSARRYAPICVFLLLLRGALRCWWLFWRCSRFAK